MTCTNAPLSVAGRRRLIEYRALLSALFVAEGGVDSAGSGGDQRLRGGQGGLRRGDTEQAHGFAGVAEADHLMGHADDDLHAAVRPSVLGWGGGRPTTSTAGWWHTGGSRG